MSELVLNLITREAVELHFEGATYGPVAHTEPLAVLLFLLAPSRIRCIASGPKFEAALARLLAAAQATRKQLEQAQGAADGFEAVDSPSPERVECWIEAAWSAVPQERTEEFRRRCAGRSGLSATRATLH